jgi:hypothetical protein
MRFRWQFAICFFFSLLYSQEILAVPEFLGLQERAQGQSLTGANLLNDSIWTNPAGSAFTNTYSLEGDYYSSNSMGVSVLDTKTSSAGGGLGYFRTPFEDYDQPVQGIKLALAEKVSNELAFGLAGKMIWGPNINGADSSYKDMDLGVLYNLRSLQLGATLRNILGGSAALSEQREWSVGGRISWQDVLFFSVSSVSTWDYFVPYQFGVGFEYMSPYYFSLKGGYRVLTANGYGYYSAGASLITPKVSLHYAVEFAAQGTSSPEHFFGASFMF